MRKFEKIEYTKISGGILFIRLNNPKSKNAIDSTLRRELVAALIAANSDLEIGAIILTGVGSDFCAGGDVKSAGADTAQEARDNLKHGHKIINQLQTIEIPVIAMVHGYAVGAGMNLALACDLIIAADDTIFAQSFVRVGLIPDAGGLYFLPRLIGVHRAKELMFSARQIAATEAMQLGIVNKIVSRKELESETLKVAKALAEGPRYTLGLIKALTNKAMDSSLSTLLELEAAAQALCNNSKENKEGSQAFIEKRKPNFSN